MRIKAIIVFVLVHSSVIFAADPVQTVPNQDPGAISNSNSTSGQQQSFNYNPVSNVNGRTAFPATGGFISGQFPSLFNDPGVGSNAVADPLIWYYMDALAGYCDHSPELKVEEEEFLTISFQPDCGMDLAIKPEGPLGKIVPMVNYVPDLNPDGYYIPLGTMMLDSNWDQSENINLLSLIRIAQDYIKKEAIGFDQIVLFGDILKRSISHQRSIDADGTSVAVTPSISSTLGRDGLAGSVVGWGRSTGSSRPHSRRGAVFVVAAVMPGPWAGRKPRVTQAAYFMNSIALPKELSDKPVAKLQAGPTTDIDITPLDNTGYKPLKLQQNTEAMIELETQVGAQNANGK